MGKKRVKMGKKRCEKVKKIAIKRLLFIGKRATIGANKAKEVEYGTSVLRYAAGNPPRKICVLYVEYYNVGGGELVAAALFDVA